MLSRSLLPNITAAWESCRKPPNILPEEAFPVKANSRTQPVIARSCSKIFPLCSWRCLLREQQFPFTKFSPITGKSVRITESQQALKCFSKLRKSKPSYKISIIFPLCPKSHLHGSFLHFTPPTTWVLPAFSSFSLLFLQTSLLASLVHIQLSVPVLYFSPLNWSLL